MLAFIDQIVIPFLNSLYGAVGYLGVMLAMAIESAMIPLPSELILPYAGFLVSDPSQLEPLTGAPWNFWIVVVFATIGNTLGSLIAYAIGAYGGRPFLERYGQVPADPPARDRARRPVLPASTATPTVFIGRLLPIVRTFISFPAGVARMPHRAVHRLLDRRRVPLVGAARLRGDRARRQLGGHPPCAPAVRPGDRGRGRRGGRPVRLVAPRDAGQAGRSDAGDPPTTAA